MKDLAVWRIYTYPARVRWIYDGDTHRVDIDLGLRQWLVDVKVRLAYVNCPEIKGVQRPNGLKARDYVRSLLANSEVRLRLISPDPGKYGRYIAQIWYWAGFYWQDLAEHLLEKGLAQPYPQAVKK